MQKGLQARLCARQRGAVELADGCVRLRIRPGGPNAPPYRPRKNRGVTTGRSNCNSGLQYNLKANRMQLIMGEVG